MWKFFGHENRQKVHPSFVIDDNDDNSSEENSDSANEEESFDGRNEIVKLK